MSTDKETSELVIFSLIGHQFLCLKNHDFYHEFWSFGVSYYPSFFFKDRVLGFCLLSLSKNRDDLVMLVELYWHHDHQQETGLTHENRWTNMSLTLSPKHFSPSISINNFLPSYTLCLDTKYKSSVFALRITTNFQQSFGQIIHAWKWQILGFFQRFPSAVSSLKSWFLMGKYVFKSQVRIQNAGIPLVLGVKVVAESNQVTPTNLSSPTRHPKSFPLLSQKGFSFQCSKRNNLCIGWSTDMTSKTGHKG